MRRVNIDVSKKPTEDQKAMLIRAAQLAVEADEDCPELSEEELKLFSKISEERRLSQKKQTVSLRLSPQALKKAQSLGKGYTSVLSRILESALMDNELIRHFL